ncbi:ankyrin repeat domain-containing protein [Shewanella yunxiaonensis]|uniref:Ankyrin repeat domain-containing protein n=1 Tax=Shewanella yunxiaonensis TaxID=2829809 RepID=A0ABX7YQJ9_9GAMM|nr:ankyrin repeat domain-containing protein [Shewanella yunxiaonensis]QUN04793.1 ankyrin repeat domain-containing protein [Shewanella yunxiaonensis]
MTNQAIYPNSFEIIRFVLRCFDLKQSNKRLDDLAKQKIYDPREVEVFIDDVFSENLNKYIGEKTSALMTDVLRSFLKQYTTQITANIAVDGLNRHFVLNFLSKTIVKEYVIHIATILHSQIGGPQADFWFASEASSVGGIFNWIGEHDADWNSFIASLEKDQKDMLGSWSRGKELPSATSITLIEKSSSTVSLDWKRIKPLIFFARAIDYIKAFELGKTLIEEARLTMWGAEQHLSIPDEVRLAQWEYHKNSTQEQRQLVAELQNGLMRTKEKSNPTFFKETIDKLRAQIISSERLKSALYWIDWHEARWLIFSGKLVDANSFYKSAVENSLFIAGDGQKHIIEEALVVAASQSNPDRVFLKQLKWALILFGYDIPSVTTAAPSQKFSDNIEDWELKNWRTHFDRVFPSKGLFKGVSYEHIKGEFGPLIFTDISKIVPDYRNPNRNIKVGETWQRTMPQLVWFALLEKHEICQRLLDEGANVNVFSEVGDTPLLMALEALNVTEFQPEALITRSPLYRSLDETTYNIIKSKPHDIKTINTRTQKKRLLPIISAVESGKLHIVNEILSMGADPNGRGKTDEQTALNICLKLIETLKNPIRSKELLLSMPITPEALDAIRRQSQGMTGFTLQDQYSSYEKMKKDPRFKFVRELTIDISFSNIKNI